jgi:hypothetical protein
MKQIEKNGIEKKGKIAQLDRTMKKRGENN